jgi:putative protease
MCTIERLPELIEAGIASFKIEGRMKRPEYAAGVTEVYRKYIDRYEKGKTGYQVEPGDIQRLQSLYIRSGTGTGYYDRHNDAKMITRDNPAYTAVDESVLASIHQQFIATPQSIEINGEGILRPGEVATLTITGKGVSVSATGAVVQTAVRSPLSIETVGKQFKKSGNPLFVWNDLKVKLADDAFMNIKDLNELRRQAIDRLEEALLAPFFRPALPENTRAKSEIAPGSITGRASRPALHVLVTQPEQWSSAVGTPQATRIYIDIDLWGNGKEVPAKVAGQEWFAVLPRIFRQRDEAYLEHYRAILSDRQCDGVMVSNLESWRWLKEIDYNGQVVTDEALYIFNDRAGEFWQNHADEHYLSPELNEAELKGLLRSDNCGSIRVYGRIPLMITANCIRKNAGDAPCISAGQSSKDKNHTTNIPKDRSGGFTWLTDRYDKHFPVYHNCRHCYNVVYNSVPLSWHDGCRRAALGNAKAVRLDFTTETAAETDRIIGLFAGLMEGADGPPIKEYTTGHFKRGVE